MNVNTKLLENIKQGFKGTISWNRYRSEKTTQPKSNSLDYLIDPTFWNINRLFVLSLKNGNDDPTRNSFDEYYIPLFYHVFSSNYDKLLLLGDFNVGVDENHMKSFCENYDLKSLIKQPTCYKNPDCPTCIDLILTNVPRSFQSTCVVETELSDFHLMTLTVLRKSFKKFQPKLIKYRSYKTFSNEAYRETLINNLSIENFINNDDGFQRFCDISLNALISMLDVSKNMLEVIKCLS